MPSDPFCVVFKVCFWIIVRLEDPNMAHYKISNRVSHFLIFYLLVFDRISDAMCLNAMSRTSSRNFFVTSDHRSQSYLKFQSCLTTEYCQSPVELPLHCISQHLSCHSSALHCQSLTPESYQWIFLTCRCQSSSP